MAWKCEERINNGHSGRCSSQLPYLATAHVLRGRFTQQKVDKVAGLEAAHKLSSIQPVVVVLFGAQKALAIHLNKQEESV